MNVRPDKTAMNRLLDTIPWTPVPLPTEPPGSLPYATHEGVLDLGGHKLRVVQLNDGRRVIDKEDVERFFGLRDEREDHDNG